VIVFYHDFPEIGYEASGFGEELGEQAAQSHTVCCDKPSGTCGRSCKIPDCSTDRGTSIQRDTL
jgi:hypothetical protein